jgi:AraC-like DNA-binding protein
MSKTLQAIPELGGIDALMRGFDRGLKVEDNNKIQVIHFLQEMQSASNVKRVALFLTLLETLSSDPVPGFLSQQTHFSISEQEGQRMSTIYQFLLNHYAEDIGLDQLAGLVHLSAPAFCRYFKKHTRKTFTVFLNEIRINAACRTLKENHEKSISDIAYSAGFNNIPHFNRTFKRVMGQRPNDWRKGKQG